MRNRATKKNILNALSYFEWDSAPQVGQLEPAEIKALSGLSLLSYFFQYLIEKRDGERVGLFILLYKGLSKKVGKVGQVGQHPINQRLTCGLLSATVLLEADHAVKSCHSYFCGAVMTALLALIDVLGCRDGLQATAGKAQSVIRPSFSLFVVADVISGAAIFQRVFRVHNLGLKT